MLMGQPLEPKNELTFILNPEPIKIAMLSEERHNKNENGKGSDFLWIHDLRRWSRNRLLQAG
jgi:hypothetical protein